jgi:predicted metal-dependent enzyme (double-stranded beta helix superfamily)
MFDELLATLYNTKQSHNYIVDNDGNVKDHSLVPIDSPNTYRLYRFLTEMEDLLNFTSDIETILLTLIPRVRQLLTDSYWLQSEYSEPPSNRGWSVKTLYQEPDYPITIQNVAWLPDQTSTIHNHGTWGIVMILQGKQKNTFWKRVSTDKFPDKIERVGERIIESGDIISFTTDAIHSIEAVGDEPTITFNLYGETHGSKRFQFNLDNNTAKNF